ncbi:MAG: SlyX family protein [Burkholderiales bacterium]|nr:SlyX family protein [Burkholderiales bacterium]
MESRLSEIEIKLGFSEDLLEELNRTVARQQQEIAELQRQLRDLRLQLQRSLPAEHDGPAHEIPPHY